MKVVIEALKQIQEREKLTDRQMGERLKIHEKSWSRLKNGRSNMNLETIHKAVQAWPELNKAAVDWLNSKDPVDDLHCEHVIHGNSEGKHAA